MTENSHSSLSGFCTGVYDYPAADADPVPFNIFIEDKTGILTGEIIEPNTRRRIFMQASGAHGRTGTSGLQKLTNICRAPNILWNIAEQPTTK